MYFNQVLVQSYSMTHESFNRFEKKGNRKEAMSRCNKTRIDI